jgi:hypothetical protein
MWEFLLLFLFAFFMITQIVVPVWRNGKFFPAFRRGRNLQKFQGSLVPTISMGGNGAGTGMSFMEILDLVGAKMAKDLAIEVSPTGAAKAKTVPAK